MISLPNSHNCRASSPAVIGGGTAAAGFTLVELVLVLTIAGILAAVAAPRFFDRTPFDERGYFDELASAMRYAQKLAVASGCPVRITLTAADYTLGQQAPLGGHCDPADAAYANPVTLPDGQVLAGLTPQGIVVAPAINFLFQPTGDTSLPGNQTINIGLRTLTIIADSGLVTAP